MLLNILNDAYNVCVRNISPMWRMIIAAFSLIFCLFFLYKLIKNSNDKHPINFGYLFLLIIFGALSILYAV